MSEAVLLAIIGCAQAVLVAAIGVLIVIIQTGRRRTRKVEVQRHSVNTEKLEILALGQEQIAEELAAVRRSQDRLWERTDRHKNQLEEIERTQPRISKPAPRGRYRKDQP